MLIGVLLPMRTGRGLNDRLHWAEKQRKVRAERGEAFWTLRSHGPPPNVGLRTKVILTRIARRSAVNWNPLDDDNLHGSLKGVRDGVADWLHVNDADPRIEWQYRQEEGAEWAVRVEVRSDLEEGADI